MHKMGWFRVVRGHPRSSAISLFDKARMISYSSLIEISLCVYLVPFSRYGESFVEIRQLRPINPTCIWRPRSNFKKIFGVRKLESLGYHAAMFASSYV